MNAIRILTVALILLAATARAERYYLTNTDVSTQGMQDLFIFVAQNNGTPLLDLFYPTEGIAALAADFPTFSIPTFPQQSPNGVIDGEPDVQLTPDDGGGGVPQGWAAVSLLTGRAPRIPAAGQQSPVIYLPDTGVTTTHSELVGSPGVSLQPGIAIARNEETFQLVPATPDTESHGTAMASVIGGSTCGILGSLKFQAKLVPVSIYNIGVGGAPATTAWTSTATSALAEITRTHRARIASVPYVRNHASIVCFAHSTTSTNYRVGFLDMAMQNAWNAGVTVVLSAGNRNILAGRNSPGGADWGYQAQSPPNQYPPFTHDPLTTTFLRHSLFLGALPKFIVVGARTEAGLRWANSNFNNASGVVVDLLAPGANVRRASNVAPLIGSGDGTSYSAAFTSAAAAWVAYLKPWATPNQIRSALVPAAVPVPPALPPSLALPLQSSAAVTSITMSYDQWVAHYRLSAESPLAGSGGNYDADPDGDGMVNFTEYYCGLDPKFRDSEIGPRIEVNMETRVLTARLPIAAYLPADMPAPQLQSSIALLAPSWSVEPINLAPVAPLTERGDGVENVGTTTIPPGDRRFYRFHFYGP